MDGSKNNYTGQIAADGIIRDSQVDWIARVMMNIGIGSVIESKIWAVFKGVVLAREMGFNCIWIESDSIDVVESIIASPTPNHPCENQLMDVRENLESFSPWNIKYINREFNSVADA